MLYCKTVVSQCTMLQDTDIVIWDVVAEAGMYRLRGHKGQVTQARFMQRCNVVISRCARILFICVCRITPNLCLLFLCYFCCKYTYLQRMAYMANHFWVVCISTFNKSVSALVPCAATYCWSGCCLCCPLVSQFEYMHIMYSTLASAKNWTVQRGHNASAACHQH